MARNKIALIGGGNIGGVLAQEAAFRELGDVVIFDVVEGLPQGKALDMAEGAPVLGADAQISGTNDYKDIAGADVVIITAGLARKPGMSRDDLLNTNLAIMKQVAAGVRDNAPNAFVIVVSNPLDAMVYTFKQISNFPKNRVVGMAGDPRLRALPRVRRLGARRLGRGRDRARARRPRRHDGAADPLLHGRGHSGESRCSPKDKLDAIVERTKNAGGEVVALLKTGSAFVSPALSAIAMAESYLRDKKRVLACACLLEGEYGVNGLYVGVPCVIGAGGVERVLEVEMDADERKLFDASLEHVRALVDQIKL